MSCTHNLSCPAQQRGICLASGQPWLDPGISYGSSNLPGVISERCWVLPKTQRNKKRTTKKKIPLPVSSSLVAAEWGWTLPGTAGLITGTTLLHWSLLRAWGLAHPQKHRAAFSGCLISLISRLGGYWGPSVHLPKQAPVLDAAGRETPGPPTLHPLSQPAAPLSGISRSSGTFPP